MTGNNAASDKVHAVTAQEQPATRYLIEYADVSLEPTDAAGQRTGIKTAAAEAEVLAVAWTTEQGVVMQYGSHETVAAWADGPLKGAYALATGTIQEASFLVDDEITALVTKISNDPRQTATLLADLEATGTVKIVLSVNPDHGTRSTAPLPLPSPIPAPRHSIPASTMEVSPPNRTTDKKAPASQHQRLRRQQSATTPALPEVPDQDPCRFASAATFMACGWAFTEAGTGWAVIVYVLARVAIRISKEMAVERWRKTARTTEAPENAAD